MKKMLIAGVASSVLSLTALLGSSVFAAEMGAKDEAIKLAVNEWTGQHVSTHLAAAALEAAGYKTELVTAGYDSQFTALADGDIHATMEIWSSNAPELYTKMSDAGSVTDIGENGIVAREGFLYPVHVKEMCPGLPAWEALEACALKFATAETIPSGRLLDYPADWGTPGADRMAGLKLPFKAVPSGSEGALIAELKASVAKKSPLFMTFWQPHWALAAYETEWVDMPAAEDACFSDPAWGVNPDAVNDCDFAPARVFKVTWAGFGEKWPAAMNVLKAVSVDTGAQQSMMAAVDQEGGKVEDVVAAWVAANGDTVAKWAAAANM
ncbi:MAG: ABC transporter substrate-binding protein [Alphaproteobacteria bacterium]